MRRVVFVGAAALWTSVAVIVLAPPVVASPRSGAAQTTSGGPAPATGAATPAKRPSAPARSISEFLAAQPATERAPAPEPRPATDPVADLLKAPPATFESRSRPSIDLSTVTLRSADVALILATLEEAPTHGFRRNEFAPADLADRLNSGEPTVRTQAERELKIALLRYARAQRGQRVAPESFPKNWGVRPDPWNPDKGFAAAVAENRLAAWIDDLAPHYAGYEALRRALATYRDLAAKGGWEKIPSGEPLKLGSTGARVAALRARLAIEDTSVAVSTRSPVLDDNLVEAVKRYQLRSGLNATGVVDHLTLYALNTTVNQRVAQIIANLERWRWLDRDMPATRIEVNIPAGGMTVYSANRPVMSMRAVAGRPTDQTPMLESQVESIVLNPPWNVPTTIAEKELWPKEKRHPGYLAAHGFKVITDANGGKRLQQAAGPSALGKLKFDFPNPYGVYLHDTPTHSTFANDSRAQSHGCVRLQHPADLAKELLKDDPRWTPEQIDAAIDTGDTKRIRLNASMPVIILYWTAYIAGGQASFRSDVYDWDKTVLSLIEASRAPS